MTTPVAHPASDLAEQLLDPVLYASDPFPLYDHLRSTAPVAWCASRGFWALTSHRDVAAVSVDPERFRSGSGILVEEIGASEDVASKSVVLLREPSFGLEPTAAIDEAGFRNMLALRASTQGGSSEVDLSHYVDLTYYRAARSRAGSGDASSTGKQ